MGYRTVAESGQDEHVEKKSRFIGIAWPVHSEEEAKQIIDDLEDMDESGELGGDDAELMESVAVPTKWTMSALVVMKDNYYNGMRILVGVAMTTGNGKYQKRANPYRSFKSTQEYTRGDVDIDNPDNLIMKSGPQNTKAQNRNVIKSEFGGGYITFSGAHRLIDAGITGEDNLKEVNKSSVTGILIAGLVRVLLFLAVLGVVAGGATLDAKNPAADAFRQGAGEVGYRFAGLVLLCAAVTSIIGAAYTSVSFLKTFSSKIANNENYWVIGFIAFSTIVMLIAGNPASLLIIAGAVNGLILPIALAICLIASQNKKIMGADYKHPKALFILGIIVVLITAYVGIKSLGNFSKLFA